MRAGFARDRSQSSWRLNGISSEIKTKTREDKKAEKTELETKTKEQLEVIGEKETCQRIGGERKRGKVDMARG